MWSSYLSIWIKHSFFTLENKLPALKKHISFSMRNACESITGNLRRIELPWLVGKFFSVFFLSVHMFVFMYTPKPSPSCKYFPKYIYAMHSFMTCDSFILSSKCCLEEHWPSSKVTKLYLMLMKS